MAELWSPMTLARVTVARNRLRALRATANAVFPRAVSSTGAHGDWPISGWAMLARMGGTADAIIALFPERRAIDAAVLLRTLLETMVTFAWIGIDPPEHAPAWLRWDRRHRLMADDDVRRSGAAPLLEPEVRAAFEEIVASGPSMPSLVRRAEAVDRHWGPRLAAFDEHPASATSTRGLYRYVFRVESQHTHTAVASLEPLISGSPPGPFRVLGFEHDPGSHSAFTRAPIVYALALIAAEPILDIAGIAPTVDRVFAAFPEP